ncbi:MAG: MMPL family transporter [Planctomycetia bacterium]|nr:MMPL family transporter [Planctomycetia bacterium]
MPHEFLTRGKRYFLFAATVILFGIILFGAQKSRETAQNRVIDWLPTQFEETQTYFWFLSHFHDGELLMISWDDCSLDDPRQEAIAERVLAPLADGSPAFFRKVITSKGVYEQLSDPELDLSHEDILDRMSGWCLSPDGQQGCLILFLSEYGWLNAAKSIKLAKDVTAEVTQIAPQDFEKFIHIAGPSIDSTEIDEAVLLSQEKLLPFFLGGCIVLLFILLRAWLGVLAIFLAAIFNEELSGALLWYSGTPTDSISMLSASLMFVLTISGGLHLTNYYRDEISHLGRKGASFGAMKKALVPCALACLTTVLGLFSLAVSKIIPIQRFGIFASIALVIGTTFFILFICSFFEEFPVRKWEPKADNVIKYSRPDLLTRLLGLIPACVWRNRIFITVFCFLMIVAFAVGLPRIKTIVTFHGMFPKDAQIIKDYDYLEHAIGGVIPVELVLAIPQSDPDNPSFANELALLDEINFQLSAIPEVDSTLSALNFVPFLPDPDASAFRAVSLRSIFNKKVAASLDELKTGCLFDNTPQPNDANYLGPDSCNLWRLSLRIAAYKNIAYGPFLDQVLQKSQSVIKEFGPELDLENARTLITGSVPLVHQTQKQLLNDLTSSYISAFVLITLCFILLLKSFWCGLLAIIPNVFPSIVVFGFMAWAGIPVDMGAMMTASVALGISVDGTFHFLTWFQRGLSSGLSQKAAVTYAYSQCATAMAQSSIICGGGMLIFGFSDFVPVAKFSILLVALVFIALFGDIVLFPAMLYGPFGKFFLPDHLKRTAARKRLELARQNDERLLPDNLAVQSPLGALPTPEQSS